MSIFRQLILGSGVANDGEKHTESRTRATESKSAPNLQPDKSTPFSMENVRLVAFRENDVGDRRILYDSNTVRPRRRLSEECQSPSLLRSPRLFSPRSNKAKRPSLLTGACNKFEVSHQREGDVKLLSEMIFGSVAMAYKGETLKVHELQQSPRRVMLSKVFLDAAEPRRRPPVQKTIDENGCCDVSTTVAPSGSDDSDSQYSTIRSVDALLPHSLSSPCGLTHRSVPMDVPERMYKWSQSSPNGGSVYERCSCRSPAGVGAGSGGSAPLSRPSCAKRGSLGAVLTAVRAQQITIEDDDQHEMLLRSRSTHGFPDTVTTRKQRGPMSPLAIGRSVSRLSQTSNASFGSLSPSASTKALTLSRSWRYRLNQETRLPTSSDLRDDCDRCGAPRYRRSRSRLSSNGSLVTTDDEVLSNHSRRQLGIGIVISDGGTSELELFRQFLLTHIHLVESEVNKLQTGVLKACENHRNFLQIVFNAWEVFKRDLCLLYSAPRLVDPVWLCLTTSADTPLRTDIDDERRMVGDRFIQILCNLADEFDRKDTEFFVSRLLTAVLRHHLSWVASVSPDQHRAQENEQHAHCSYNPYLAQYMDVTGAVGDSTVRSAKTVITGRRRTIIEELLYVLSYFIRCSQVQDGDSWRHFHDELFSAAAAPNTPPPSPNRREALTPINRSTALLASAVEPNNNKITPNDHRLGDDHRTQLDNSGGDGYETKRLHTPQRLGFGTVQSRRIAANFCSAAGGRPQSRSVPYAMMLLEQRAYPIERKTSDGALLPPSASIPVPTVIAEREDGRCATFRMSLEEDEDNSGSPLGNAAKQQTMNGETSDPSAKTSTTGGGGLSSIDSGIEDGLFVEPCRDNNSPTERKTDRDVYGMLFCASTNDEWQQFNSSSDDQLIKRTADQLATELKQRRYCCDLGRSMLAGLLPTYCPHFALSGVDAEPDADFYYTIIEQLGVTNNTTHNVSSLTKRPTVLCSSEEEHTTVVDVISAPELTDGGDVQNEAPTTTENVCIVANTSDWSVKVLTSASLRDVSLRGADGTAPSKVVLDMLETLVALRHLGASSDTCLSHIEDSLYQLFTMSEALSDYLSSHQDGVIDNYGLTARLGCDWSDLPLLMSLAGLHSPAVLQQVSY